MSSLCLVVCLACTGKKDPPLSTEEITSDPTELIDSLLYFKSKFIKSDILSRRIPTLDRREAAEIQLQVLQKEISMGSQLIGWKMGGTTGDSLAFDPVFGYMLTKNMIKPDSIVSIKNFPGAMVMIEGEVGFVFNKDFKDGVKTREELIDGIDYVVGAVEFAQSNNLPLGGQSEMLSKNHVLAFGMGHAGVMLGNTKVKFADFNSEAELVSCFIDEKLAASGGSSRVYGGHLNALESLINMLPQYDLYIRSGDVVITGSLYQNPLVNSACKVHMEFKTLGTIDFSVK